MESVLSLPAGSAAKRFVVLLALNDALFLAKNS